MAVERGAVCWTNLAKVGRKPVVVVSAGVVTRALRPVVARVSSVDRDRPIPTAVALAEGEVPGLRQASSVICHDLFTLLDGADLEPVGMLSPRRMVEVEDALRVVLDLD